MRSLLSITTFCLASLTKAQDVALFESKVLPVLKQRCFECHSHEKKMKGGLTLDSKSGWEEGGENGGGDHGRETGGESAHQNGALDG
jgi:hypothetical protein